MARKPAGDGDRDPLTNSLLRDLAPPAKGNCVIYDGEVRGFGVRITAGGGRAFVLNYRAHGIERRLTIGSFPDWNTKQAREEAKVLKRRIDRGEDPMADRHADRTAPTMAVLTARYLEYAGTRKRPRSLQEDKSLLDGVILPALRNHRVADLRRADVVALYHQVSKRTPIRANRMLSLLRRMLNLAATEFEMREGPNPAAAIERNPENKRDRYLKAEEVAPLMTALAAHRNQQSANIIRLALLTGARRGELLTATWDQIDVSDGIWTKPASMTKQKKLHAIPLNGPARALLADMKKEADKENARRAEHGLTPIAHLFPGYGTNDAQGDLKRSWQTICQAAGLGEWIEKRDDAGRVVKDEDDKSDLIWRGNLRFHDLRHAFASFLASSGHNLPLIGQLLGHSNPQTTARYAHLLLDPQREATERVGQIITGAGKPGAEILPMPAGRRA